jgi:hypothetical protein
MRSVSFQTFLFADDNWCDLVIGSIVWALRMCDGNQIIYDLLYSGQHTVAYLFVE